MRVSRYDDGFRVGAQRPFYNYHRTRAAPVGYIYELKFKFLGLNFWKLVKTDLGKLEAKDVTGYKLCIVTEKEGDALARAIVELRIPWDAFRVQPRNDKCRADRAEVVAFTTLKGDPYVVPENCQVVSRHDPNFEYRLGETVVPALQWPKVASHHWEECGPGIHFFLERVDAAQYW